MLLSDILAEKVHKAESLGWFMSFLKKTCVFFLCFLSLTLRANELPEKEGRMFFACKVSIIEFLRLHVGLNINESVIEFVSAPSDVNDNRHSFENFFNNSARFFLNAMPAASGRDPVWQSRIYLFETKINGYECDFLVEMMHGAGLFGIDWNSRGLINKPFRRLSPIKKRCDSPEVLSVLEANNSNLWLNIDVRTAILSKYSYEDF